MKLLTLCILLSGFMFGAIPNLEICREEVNDDQVYEAKEAAKDGQIISLTNEGGEEVGVLTVDSANFYMISLCSSVISDAQGFDLGNSKNEGFDLLNILKYESINDDQLYYFGDEAEVVKLADNRIRFSFSIFDREEKVLNGEVFFQMPKLTEQ